MIRKFYNTVEVDPQNNIEEQLFLALTVLLGQYDRIEEEYKATLNQLDSLAASHIKKEVI